LPETYTSALLLRVEDVLWQAELAPESIGWTPLGDGAYLHLGKPEEEEIVITVVGVPEVGMAGMNVLLVGW